MNNEIIKELKKKADKLEMVVIELYKQLEKKDEEIEALKIINTTLSNLK